MTELWGVQYNDEDGWLVIDVFATQEEAKAFELEVSPDDELPTAPLTPESVERLRMIFRSETPVANPDRTKA